MVLTTVSLSPQSEITRSKYFGGIELIELTEASDTLNYKPVFKHCILHIVLFVFLLFIYVWNKIFCPKNKNPKYTIYDIDYRRDASLCTKVWKEITKRKTMRENNVK